jgi:hypothetical protein
VKNFSSQIRFGNEDLNALIRVQQLKENLSTIESIINEAKHLNKNLVINSFVEIKYE